MYTPYYRTPRLYLSGYSHNNQPLPPQSMMDDIVGDYKDKTVTLEDFPFFAHNIKMASVHPCKHASVMKTLLDRADAALRIRRDKMREGKVAEGQATETGVEGLVDEIGKLDVKSGAGSAGDKDDWEEVKEADVDEHEVAIRVDQYLVVFLKVISPPTHTLFHSYAGPLPRHSPFCLCLFDFWIVSLTLLLPSLVHGQRHTGYRTRLHNGGVRNGTATANLASRLWHGCCVI